LAILVPAQETQALQLRRLALVLATAASCLVLMVWAVAAIWPQLHWPIWLVLLPLSMWLTAVYAVVSNWANRRQAYNSLASSRVFQSALTAAVSIALGMAAWGAAGLVLGAVLGQALGTWVLWRDRSLWVPAAEPFNADTLKKTAREFVEFPRINLPHAMLDATQSALVLGLLGAAYGGVALGSYAFALRVVRTPLAMVGASVGQVFQQRAAQLMHGGHNTQALLRKTAWRLLTIALPFALLMGVAPPLFAWAFGTDWRQAGLCALLLTPWMLASFLTSPFSTLPLLVGQQRPAFVWGLAYQAAMVLPLALAWAAGAGFEQALLWQSLVAAGVLLGYGVWLWRLAAPKAA
jgi:O-antigen/teichoic acid export membrane protein